MVGSYAKITYENKPPDDKNQETIPAVAKVKLHLLADRGDALV